MKPNEHVLETRTGVRIVWEETGQGEPIVLVHGTPGSSSSWRPVAQVLADRYHCLLPNLPGYGGSDPRPAGATPTTDWDAEQIEELLRTLSVPALLVGHSYGGNVCLSVALRSKVALRGLALLEPVTIPALLVSGEDELHAEAMGTFERYVDAFQRGEPDAVIRMVDFWFGEGAFERMPEPLRDYLRRNTGKNVLDVLATFRERYSRETLATLELPVLAGYGTSSPRTLFKLAHTIATHAGQGRLVGISGANHALTTTHVERVAQLLDEHAVLCARSH